MEFEDKSGFFYIIKTADTPENVYKIGKTCQSNPNKRLCQYPAYSCCKYTIFVDDADLFEDLVMRKLKLVTKRRMEFGLEYYEADLVYLIDTIHQLWLKYGSAKNKVLDKSVEKVKPNGWQYFVNEWLSKNPAATVEEAYHTYVDIMKTVFNSREYAEFEPFALYFTTLDI